ncbi:MAG: leucine-rich repeat domain-containing protein [Clostridia bacterium]|nr:leucine-rich repeat domain-containing protein [Clostridia bacterium]
MKDQQLQGYINGIRDGFILEAQPRALAALIPAEEEKPADVLPAPGQKSRARSKKRWIPIVAAAAVAVTVGLHIGLYSGIVALTNPGGSGPASAPSSPGGNPLGDLFGSLFPFLSPETEPPYEVTIRDLDDVTEPPPPPDTRTECEKGNHEWVFDDPGDATCYRAGSVLYTCASCEATKTEAEKIPHVHKDGFCTVCGMIEGAWEDVTMEGYGDGDLNGDTHAVILLVQGEPSGKLILPNLYYSAFWDRMVPVTEIRSHAVSRQTAVTEVVIPETVTVIGNHAFSGCSALEWVNFPEGLTSVGTNAFHGCEMLRMAHLPNSVVELGEGVFQNCKALESATFPAGVEDIPISMYSGCEKLSLVNYDGDIRTIGIGAFMNCRSLSQAPPLHKVTSIGTSAFKDCEGLTEIILPVTLRELGHTAFESCGSLKKVTIEAPSLAGIYTRVFWGCTSLKEITLPKNVGVFSGEEMFSQCNALTIHYPGTREEWQKTYKNLKLPLNTKVIFEADEEADEDPA